MGKNLLIPRRTLLKSAAAFVASAPFIARSPYANAFVLGGAQAPAAPAGDSFSAAVSGATTNQWTNDLIVGSNHLSDVIQVINNANFQQPGDPATWGSSKPPSWELTVFGGTCYGNKAVWLSQCAGHVNGPTNSSQLIDLTVLKWILKDQSCKYTSLSNADPSNPVNYPDTNGFRIWPNAAGRRSQGAGHAYGYPEYCVSLGVIFLKGAGTYTSGVGIDGWGRADASTGLFLPPSGNQMGGAEGTTIWVSECSRIFSNNGFKNAGNPVGGWAGFLDPSSISNSFVATHRMDSVGIWPDGEDTNNSFVLIPDPSNPGQRCAVTWAVTTDGIAREAVCYFAKVSLGVAGGTSQVSATFPGSPNPWTVPSILAAATYGGTHLSSWFANCADFKVGSTKILIVNWHSTPGNGEPGLYLLDWVTWTFSALPNSTLKFDRNAPAGSNGFGNKSCAVATDYVTSTVIPITVTNPNDGEIYLYPLLKSSV